MKKKTLFIMLSALIAMILISCPLPAPMSSSQVQDLMIPPLAPRNVTASMFNSDRIEVSWDEVENADGYIVMMIDGNKYADNEKNGFGMGAVKHSGLETLIKRGFVQVATKQKGETSALLQDKKIVPGNHYVLAVVSFKDYNGIKKYSESSEYIEGSTIGVVNSLKELVYPTGVKITWGCPAMDSALNYRPDGKPEPLYEHYDFTVSFKEVGSNAQERRIARVGENSGRSIVIPLIGTDLDGNEYQLRSCQKADKDDATSKDTIIQYEFWVTVNVYSSADHDPSTLLGSSAKNISVIVEIWPSGVAPKVTDLVINETPHVDDIEISWREPYVVGILDYRSVYRIERQKADSEEWELILSETDSMDAIKKDGYSCSFRDVTAEKNTDYKYRVTFGYAYSTPAGNETYVIQTGDIPETSSYQHFIWVPTDIMLTGFTVGGTPDVPMAEAVISWNMPGSPDEFRDAEWYVKPARWSSMDSAVHEYDAVTVEPDIVDGKAEVSLQVSITEDMGRHLNIFSFTLGYRNGDADFKAEAGISEGIVPEIGHKPRALFGDFKASSDRVGEVELSWTPLFKDEAEKKSFMDGEILRSYVYQVDNGSLIDDLPVDPVWDDSGRMKVVLGNEDLPSGKESWQFRMTVNQGYGTDNDSPDTDGVESYTNSLPITGSLLPVPVISATQGESLTGITVTVDNAVNEGIKYEISYAPKASAADEGAWKVIPDFGMDLTADDVKPGEVLTFRARAVNPLQGADAPYTDVSETVDGAIFGGYGIVLTAAQGQDAQKIALSWTPAMGAEKYRVMRRPVAQEGMEPYEWVVAKKETSKLAFADNISTLQLVGMDELIPLSEKYEYMVIPLRTGLTDTEEAITALQTTCVDNTAEGWLFMPPREQYVSRGTSGISTVDISWTEVPDATSYTIQTYTYKKVETKDEKGEVTSTEYVPVFSENEGIHVDVAEGLADGSLTKSVTDDGRTFYHITRLGSVDGLFYAIRANNSRISISSEFQKKYLQTTDEVGNMLPSNYGYAFDTSAIQKFTAETVMSDGLYADYIRLQWKRVRGADTYIIGSSAEDNSAVGIVEISVKDLDITRKNSEGQVNNGKNKNEPGYLMYDPASDMFTYNDNSGEFRTVNSIKKYTNSGFCKAFDPDAKFATEEKSFTTPYNLHRQLKPEEIINISNSALRPHIQAADSKFGGDWFQGLYDISYSSDDGSFSVKVKGAALSFNYDKSFIALKDLKHAGMTLNSSRILLRPMNADNYLKDNSLYAIGHGGDSTDSEDNWSIITLTAPGFRPYQIWYTNIGKRGNTEDGMYKIKDGTKTFEIRDDIRFERPF